jgi:hypothetical protein
MCAFPGALWGRVGMSLRKWLHLPGRIALLLGVGALSAAGAKAAVMEPHLGNGPVRSPQQSAKSFGEVLIWSEGGRIYFSESGHEAQELRLGNTPNSPHILQHRMILVGGGGAAVHWGGTPSKGRDNAGSPPTANGSDKVTRAGKGPPGRADNADKPNLAGADRQK